MTNFDCITVKQLRQWLSEFPDDMIYSIKKRSKEERLIILEKLNKVKLV